MAVSGKKVIRASTISNGTIKGAVAITHCSNLTPDTLDSTYSTIPTGGVSSPSIRFKITMMPRWTGSMPTFSAIGSSTGTRMVIAAI